MATLMMALPRLVRCISGRWEVFSRGWIYYYGNSLTLSLFAKYVHSQAELILQSKQNVFIRSDKSPSFPEKQLAPSTLSPPHPPLLSYIDALRDLY
jgi:hypothetical protein